MYTTLIDTLGFTRAWLWELARHTIPESRLSGLANYRLLVYTANASSSWYPLVTGGLARVSRDSTPYR